MAATGYTTDPRAVISVEGQTGVVDLDADDVGAAAAVHSHDGTYSPNGHNHSGTYANASHTHAASDVASGTLDIARVPTGTSGTTVALGNHTHAATAFVAPSGYGTGASSAGDPYYAVGSSVEASGRARLRGRVALAQNYTAGAQIMTLDSSAWPAKEVAEPCRIVGVGAANGSLTITTAGVVSYSGNITVGAGTALLCDGITYTLTA